MPDMISVISGFTGARSKLALAFAAAALLIASIAHTAAAEEVEAFYIASELQARYRSIDTVSARFNQEFHPFGFDKPVVSAGHVYFKKPGMMKWIYKAGLSDVLTSDGKTIWLFQPDLNQVVETKADLGSAIATDFLSGIGNLKKDFTIKLAKKDKSAYVLELTPMAVQPNVKRLFLHVDKPSGMVIKTIVEDFFGNKTNVSFSNIEVNMPVKDSFFVFTPPPGVNVVKE